MKAKFDPNDLTTWPEADAIPTDEFVGEFTHDCTPQLSEEQKIWPVADALPTDVFLGEYREICTLTPPTNKQGVPSDTVPPDGEQIQPSSPACS